MASGIYDLPTPKTLMVHSSGRWKSLPITGQVDVTDNLFKVHGLTGAEFTNTVTFPGDVSITGDLEVAGETSLAQATVNNLQVTDLKATNATIGTETVTTSNITNATIDTETVTNSTITNLTVLAAFNFAAQPMLTFRVTGSILGVLSSMNFQYLSNVGAAIATVVDSAGNPATTGTRVRITRAGRYLLIGDLNLGSIASLPTITVGSTNYTIGVSVLGLLGITVASTSSFTYVIDLPTLPPTPYYVSGSYVITVGSIGGNDWHLLKIA